MTLHGIEPALLDSQANSWSIGLCSHANGIEIIKEIHRSLSVNTMPAGSLRVIANFQHQKADQIEKFFLPYLLCINSAHDKLGTNRLQISYRLIKWHEKTWNSFSISSYLLLKWPLFFTPYFVFSRGRQSTFNQVLKKCPRLDSNLQPNESKSNTLSAGLYSHASVTFNH